MLQLTEDDIRRRLDPVEVIAAIESAFRDRYPSAIIAPRIQLPVAGGVVLVMPCYDRARNTMGMKVVTVQDHPQRAEERVQATYLMLDPATVQPRMIIPANYLTDVRTAATSAVATKYLAREDTQTLGIFGTGRQARVHLRLLPLVRDFRRILVCGRTFDQSRKLISEVSAGTRLLIEPADAATCAAESDVICTCTASTSPLFEGKQLRPGTHLNLVGTFQPHAQEVDSTTIQRARIVVDTYEGALAEAGDLMIPLKQEEISRDHILANLHELVSGKKPVRRSRDDVTVFKSVGCALEDLVTAELLSST